jgi:peptide-N4-(N-acetyl-beta-glucosaminyl)asparagine amidase
MRLVRFVLCIASVASFIGATPGTASTAPAAAPVRSRAACQPFFHSVGDAQRLPFRERLTPAEASQHGAAWTNSICDVEGGFTVRFRFQINQDGADGFTFAVQNADPRALGGTGGTLGYAGEGCNSLMGIPNSLVVEFDTWFNGPGECDDPNDNHISVHTRGTDPNDADERYSLGATTDIPFMSDDRIHLVKITYTPGVLSIYLDNPETAALTVDADLASLLQLTDGQAWLGFTAATGGAMEEHDIVGVVFG